MEEKMLKLGHTGSILAGDELLSRFKRVGFDNTIATISAKVDDSMFLTDRRRYEMCRVEGVEESERDTKLLMLPDAVLGGDNLWIGIDKRIEGCEHKYYYELHGTTERASRILDDLLCDCNTRRNGLIYFSCADSDEILEDAKLTFDLAPCCGYRVPMSDIVDELIGAEVIPNLREDAKVKDLSLSDIGALAMISVLIHLRDRVHTREISENKIVVSETLKKILEAFRLRTRLGHDEAEMYLDFYEDAYEDEEDDYEGDLIELLEERAEQERKAF